MTWFSTDKDGSITAAYGNRVFDDPRGYKVYFLTQTGEHSTAAFVPFMAEGGRPFGFQGDFEEGSFRYDGNRYFLTSYGRWINQGAPSSAPPSPNRYAYVYSEPGPNRDTSGEEAKEDLSTRGLDGWTKFVRSWDKVLGNYSNGWLTKTTNWVTNNTPQSTTPAASGSDLSTRDLGWWTKFVRSWDNVLGDLNTGWFKGFSDFSAGMGDTVSGGLTRRIRQGFGYNDVVDASSDAYRYGGYAGQVVNIALTVANPVGWAKTAVTALNVMSTAEGAIGATEALVTGQGWQQAALIGAGAGASWLRGAGSPCQVGQSLSRFGQIAKTLGTTGQRGLALFGMGSGVASGVQRIAAGDTIGGVLDILGAGASAYRFMQACFTGDRLVETDRGPRRIDSIQKGDRLLARSEGDLNGPLEYKEVLQTFVRVAPVLNLHVAGKLIPTTKEHPFWLKDIGWMPAGELMPGDLIAGKLEGEWLLVEGVADSGQVLTVYNVEVEEHHTYFVTGEGWAFSVWAHNADCRITANGSVQVLKGTGVDGKGPRRWQTVVRIPKDATVEPWKPIPGGAAKGIKFKWEDGGSTFRARVHSPDPGAPTGSNSASGWILRVFKGSKPMTPDGSFHPPGVVNPNSPYFSAALANETHIPIDPSSFLLGGRK